MTSITRRRPVQAGAILALEARYWALEEAFSQAVREEERTGVETGRVEELIAETVEIASGLANLKAETGPELAAKLRVFRHEAG